MSDYAAKLSSLSEKKLKLNEEEKELMERRKKEIGQLAQKFDLLTVPDDLIAGFFAFGKKAIAEKADCVKEWQTLSGRFQNETKPKQSKKVKANVSAVDESTSIAV